MSEGGPLSKGPRSSQDLSRLGLAVPSDPRPPSRPSVHLEVQDGGRAGRIPLAVGLGVVLVLIAIPLYLWRRPSVESVALTNAVGAEAAAAASAAVPSPSPSAAPTTPVGVGGAPVEPATLPSGVQVGEPRVLSCVDGLKKLGGDACDRLPTVERALSRAVEESATCLAHDAGPGSIQFAFDVGFRKKSIAVATPREARTIKSSKAVAGCAAQVKSKLSGRLLEGVPHGHERYRIVVTAAFPAPRAPVSRPKP